MLQNNSIVKDTLNPKLFDTQNNILLKDVHDRILLIVDSFLEQLDVPIEVADVQLVGSNCSYNYTDTSDIDVHIIANFELVSSDISVLRSAYDMGKQIFNSRYDIKIKGLDVELYVQDINSGITSNGIYSVVNNNWVKFPEKIRYSVSSSIVNSVEKWKRNIDALVSEGNHADLSYALNTVYMIRRNSIAVDGEYGAGNLLFKELRSTGYIQKLKDAIDNSVSSELSLEGYTPGYIVNRM